MPAKSKSQQRLMGMAYAYKKDGDLPDDPDLAKKVKELANSMSLKDLKDFAETSHKGLPESMVSFKEFNEQKSYNDKAAFDLARGKGDMRWLMRYDNYKYTGLEMIVQTSPKGKEKDAIRQVLQKTKGQAADNIKVVKKLGIVK